MANITGTFLSERINPLGTYYWDGASWVFLNSNGTTIGADTVHAGIGNDEVDGAKGNDSLFGEAGNDLLIGGSGNDLIDGGADDDIIYGGTQTANATGSGTDDLRGGLGNDVIHAGDGNDTLGGNDGNDKLFGEAGNDDLNGGAGADILVGGAGADKLAGGAGGDLYVLDLVSDSQATAAGAFNSKTGDAINGFTSAAEMATASLQDKIDLRGLVTQIGHTLTWSGAAASNYSVWSSVSGGSTFVNVDTTGDHIADVVVKISTMETLTASDIITEIADATAPTVSSTAYGTPGGSLNAGDTVTLAVTFSEPVVVAGGTPTLALNSGGTATYLSGSGSSTLTFSYTVTAGQNTSDLAITSLILNSATITDATGNIANISGAASNPSGILTVDTVAPSAPTVALATDSGASNNDGISKVGALSVGGSETGSLIEYSTNGGTIWSSSFTAVEGANSVLVRQTDVAGNVSSSTSFSFTFDTNDPAAPNVALATDSGSSGNDLLTNDGTLSVASEVGAHVEYSTNGGTSWSSSFTAVEGSNSVLVRQTDMAGNVSAETDFTFVLDPQAPSAPGVALIVDSGASNTDHITNNGALNVTGIEIGATVEYSLDGGAHWQSTFAPQFGPNAFAVRQTDAAGNSSTATDFVFSLVQEGYAVDGYISGATVFADADGNGQLDVGEYSAVTDDFGHFVLQGGSGNLVVIGGTDTSTNNALIGTLTAPSGSAVVSPLTTLVTLLVDDPASNLDVAGAEAMVLVALGLAPDIDLLTLDPITAAFQNDADTFLAGISILNTVSMMAAAIAGAGGDQDAAATSVFSALTSQILGLGAGEALDLTNSSTIGVIAEAAASGALDADLLQALQEVVVASNQTLADDAATASTPAQLVADATAIAFVAQGSASNALAAAADDPGQIDAVVNSYSGSGLDAAVISALNQIGNIAPAVQAHATLTEGTDNLGPSILNTTVISAAPDLNPTDSIDLGGGYDVLALFGGGSFDLNGPSVLAGVDAVRLTYVNGSGPTALTLRDGMDISVSVSGSGNETSIYLSSGNVSLDLDGIHGGFYHLSSGTAIIDGADGGADDSSYYFSTGEATISDANAAFNRYYLSSGTATIHAGGVFNSNDDGGYNYYYLADGTYALHGADANQDIFVLNNAAQLQTTSLIDGGTGSYNDQGGSTYPLKDTVVFNGSFDLTVPFSTVISNIEAYSIGGTLKVEQANLAGINSIYGGTLTTEEAALDLSGMTVSSRIESSNADGTIFTVTDAFTVSHVYGGEGDDTLIASGLTLSADQRAAIFLNSSVETIMDGSGTYVAPLQLTAGADTLAFDSSDLTNSTLNATAPDLNPTDSIDLGGGYDVLALFGGGSFD
ncbi:hypothetical protein NKH57_32650, partial [Mesorhizobium sp. M1050]|uniref:beta strand repeat-containing protein n=1 Tax=Mesorhizobium sp. M1050 TaxID=2957051 RepID=UPI00333A36AA